jgi:hypothetical protein
MDRVSAPTYKEWLLKLSDMNRIRKECKLVSNKNTSF